MITQKITYDKKTYNLKSYKEYIDNVLIKTELYDKQGNLYKVKTIQQETSYKNNQFHGINKIWCNGNLYSYGKWKNGKRHGIYKTYYPNSNQLRYEYHFNNGQLNGIYYQWYPNGNIREKAKYKNGKLLQITTYYESGEVLENKTFLTKF